MELEIKSDFLKENIILNNPIENPEFRYILYTKNLKVNINENKEILFFDNTDGKEVFTMEVPYMIDNQGELSKDIDVQCIEKEDGVQELVIKPNKEWLNAPKRAYPVKIDPPVRSSLDVKKIQDAFVASGLPTQNYREADRLGVGNGKYSKTTRSFLKFELPQISSADMIIDAKLYSLLFSDQNNNTQINVHKVLGNWDSKSITWNRKPNFSSKIEDYAIVKGKVGSIFHWDITAIAKEWYNSGNNYGLMLKNNNESSGYTEFLSSDIHKDFKGIRPQVVFYYVNNSGLEDYWSYHSQEVGRAGTGHVNDYNGNLVFTHNDLSTNGNLMPASISHVYNSNEKDKSIGFGLGWRLNYYQTIEPKIIEGKRWYEYTDSDGTKHHFKYDDKEKIYKEDSGLDLKFKINSDGSYEIKDKDDNTLTFTKWGYLYIVKDKNNNKLTINYGGTKVRSITDGAGKQIKFDVLSNGYLVGITDPAGRRTSFTYSGIKLSKITYPDGKYTLYEYNSDNTLKLVTNYDGYQMQYEYYGSKPNRVKKVLEKHSNGTLGGELSLVYGFNQTTFKDVKGRSHIYQFNNLGNTVSVKDTDGSAEYYKYFDKENNKNKLELESKLQKTTKNYLKNHNIELNNTEWTKDSWTGSSGSADVTSEDKYLGNKSLKINKTNDKSRQFYSQSLNLEKGKTYTLSAYVKSKNISNKNSKGAGVFVNYQNNKGSWETVESRFISGSNDWDRLEVKFTLPKDSASNQVLARAGIMSETGIAYIDSFQLEEGSIANRYNMLENANFMYTSGDKPLYWTKAAECDSGDKYEVFEGRKTFKVNGNATKNKNIGQVVSASGKKGDTFVVSGWGKSDSVPTHSQRYFALDVGIKKKGSNEYQWTVVPFNQDSSQWQFVSEKVVAKHDYDRITVYGLYYLNANTAHFSDIQLFKEEFGQSYTYDSKGNVISVEDLSKQKSKFEYNGNNDLVKSIDPKGNEFKYEYDGKRNVTKATTSENVVYSFTYDSKGNPLTSKVSGSGLFMESSAEYTANGNYMKSMTDSSGNKIGYDWNETKGLLNKSIDSKGNETNYKYDNLDRVISVDKDIKNESLVQIPFNHNLNNNSGIQPIESQSVTFERDLKGDMSMGAFQSTYNLLSKNSSFENTTSEWALTDWNKSTGKWRLVQDGAVGKYSLECYDSDGKTDGSITNAIAYQYVEYPSVTTEEKILSLSAYAKRIGNATPGLSVVCYDNSGNEIGGSYKIHMQDIVENKWCRISKEFNVPKGTKKVRAVLRSNVKDKELVRFDGVQLEEKPFPTPYTDNRRSGGTSLKYNFNINDEEGAFSSFFKLAGNKNDSKTIISTEKEEKSLFSLYLDKENNLQLSVKDKNKQIKNIITVNKDQIKKDNWHFVLVNWKKLGDEYKFSLYLDDKNYEAKVKDVEDFSGGITSIGSNAKGTQILEGYLERFVYSNKNLSVEEIGTLKQKKDIKSQNIKVTNNYTYENDNIKTVSHNGFSYIFNYDVFGNTTSVNVGKQQLINNKYEARTGKLLESTYGNGHKTSLDYDGTDAVIGKRFNGQLKYRYEHDANGNLGYKEDLENGVNYRYIYDVADRLVKVEDSKGNYFTTDYDKNNNKSKIIERINGKVYTTSYSYDKDNRVKDTTLPSGSKVLNNYDSIGRITKNEVNTGKTSLNTTFTFEAGYKGSQTNRISSMKNNNKEILYTYDKNGNIETIKSEGKLIKYHYNSLNEVIREDNEPLGKTIVYNYDVGGNITSKIEYEYVGSQKLGKEIKTYNYEYGDSNWKDKLTSFDGKEITYDAIGNPLSYDGYKFTWQHGRQLKSISGNNKNISYKYNDSGIRTEKSVNGEVTKYHLNGSDVAYEETLDSTGKVKDSIYYNYDASNHLVSMTLNSEEYFYIRNAQNDIIALTDKSGKEVVTYNYDTWGKLISVEGTLKDTVGIKNPYRYRGYRYDIETGFYYLSTRYYNTNFGRFINMDSLGGKIGVLLSHNVFAYCMNNPVNMEDSSGNFPLALRCFGELTGGAIAAVGAVLSSTVVIAGALILTTCFLGYTIYNYYSHSSSGSSSSKISSKGGVTGKTNINGGGIRRGGSNRKPPKKYKKPRKIKKTTHGHHTYPKYLGGAVAQKLVELAPQIHRELHAAIHKFEGGWLAPKKGYTGKTIQYIYDKQQIQEGLIRFYNSIDEFKDLLEPLKEAIRYTMEK
ncbi:DNRLRE domain-containing protein [Hathewaya histolytica]|uniref:Putative cell wall associated protein n=3 Tax=Hathewaya histolytica TaxID=1498 RepID=A0A4U9R939_HATHI|nr:DNRLRE domain-containing protein [Hathewaya histolytica]VTQ88082.1 putative cell wall associated protein [Hathewaya histolytica]